MRILPDELWQAVKAKQEQLSTQAHKFWTSQRPRYLLSGLLKCGCCGGSFSKTDARNYSCVAAKNSGKCENRLVVKKAQLEASVLDALRFHLLNPEALKVFCEEYTHQVNALRMGRNARIHQLQAELEHLEADKRRLIDAIKAGVPGEEVKDDMHRIVAKRTQIEAELANAAEAPVLLHPQMAHHYAKSVTNLVGALDSGDQRNEAQELLRSLIDRIVLTPNAAHTSLQIDLHGDLAGILSVAENAQRNDKAASGEGSEIKLVEGTAHTFRSHARPRVAAMKLVGLAGLEPATRPL
ncbi:MAG: zinc ribbon domain-containing protein [Caulobacteraceae bacterium]|nr:zinc ribbon domain-containing protein [Caulobacteraceae bacterium]